ncbi:MAG: GAF domain-containing sensor histidine kinase [Chloroflexi bacterium]|nr:GAF domain-containing sensor histidine kinase [Chloroflexota bacterium]
MSPINETLDNLESALRRWQRGDAPSARQAMDELHRLRGEVGALGRVSDELSSLYEVSRQINTILDLGHLLGFIMDRAILLAQAERGFLVLYDAARDDFEVAVARRFSSGESDNAQAEISHALIRRVLSTHQPVITTNAQEDPRFQASQSIIAYQIRGVLAVPLETPDELVGAIYLDTRLSERLFTQGDLALVKGFADQAATALRIARLYDHLQAQNLALEQALAELRQAQDELIRAERLSVVGRMASGIIHDLKNPMTTIKGYADLLGRADLPADTRERFSAIILNTIDAFVGMTQEILDYARGSSALALRPTPVGPFVDDLCALLEPDFTKRNIRIERRLRYDGEVLMDRDKMWRVFMNIADNARDALDRPDGVFMITCQLAEDQVEFWLADNGPGIPPEIKSTLFEPFVTHGKQYGTGLGLAISAKIVEDHHGSIAVQSRPGQGACFIIRLPRGAMTPNESEALP